MVLSNTGNTANCSGGSYSAWFCSAKSLELAYAGNCRLACYHLLAGDRHSRPMQNSLWRLSRQKWDALAPPYGRALGEDDSGRTREIQPGFARSLWLIST